MKRISKEIYFLLEGLFASLPGFLGGKLRTWNYNFWLGGCGKNFYMGLRSRIQSPDAMFVGDNVGFNDNAWIAANPKGGQIYIGNDVLIGPNCVLHTGNHVFKDRNKTIRSQKHEFGEIHISDDVWLAANVTVLKGVKIGKGAVVAAGSIVTKNVADYAIVAGVPAKQIGER